eukprot:3498871-Prymnesium_polylepis.1
MRSMLERYGPNGPRLPTVLRMEVEGPSIAIVHLGAAMQSGSAGAYWVHNAACGSSRYARARAGAGRRLTRPIG